MNGVGESGIYLHNGVFVANVTLRVFKQGILHHFSASISLPKLVQNHRK
jgi:hypothetical protein